MINPVRLAKDNGLWPEFGAPAGEADRERFRDDARAKVRKLMDDYRAWAESDRGIIDDPGPPPPTAELPMTPPEPHDSETDHRRFRRVTDAWFDTEYLPRHLPEYMVWSVANDLWQAKRAGARTQSRSHWQRRLRMLRFLSYTLGAPAAGVLVVLLLSVFTTTLPALVAGALCGIATVLILFVLDYGLNKLEDYISAKRKT